MTAAGLDCQTNATTSSVERLRLAWHLSKIEVMLFVREPSAMFFTLLFPLMLLIFVGVVYGDEVDDDGLRYIDVYFPTLLAAVAANLGVMGVTINIAESRARGVLRRYRIAPFPFSTYMISQIVVGLFMYVLSSVSILIAVALLYGFNLQGSILLFVAILLLGLAVMMTLGFLIGGLNITVRTSQLIGTVAFFFMFFGSGGAIPRSQFPVWMQNLTEVNPLTHLSDSLIQIYLGRSLSAEIPGLIGLSIGLFMLIYFANTFFSWEVQP
ncbi:MAG: ABC transporter permease [Acidimicrobiaceae bacterium]|nr:ABC transporter permease [Acidimicrobiaceae bacterium]